MRRSEIWVAIRQSAPAPTAWSAVATLTIFLSDRLALAQFPRCLLGVDSPAGQLGRALALPPLPPALAVLACERFFYAYSAGARAEGSRRIGRRAAQRQPISFCRRHQELNGKGSLHRAGLIQLGRRCLDMSDRLAWMALPAHYPSLGYSSAETLSVCLLSPDCLLRLHHRRRPSLSRLPSSARTPYLELAIPWSSDAPIFLLVGGTIETQLAVMRCARSRQFDREVSRCACGRVMERRGEQSGTSVSHHGTASQGDERSRLGNQEWYTTRSFKRRGATRSYRLRTHSSYRTSSTSQLALPC
jgi:hypothetical protein